MLFEVMPPLLLEIAARPDDVTDVKSDPHDRIMPPRPEWPRGRATI
jgi:hypothetical protein